MIFEIDPLHSVVEFAVRHLMISVVKGRFSDVHGSIELDTQHPERSWVKAQVKTDSIYTGSTRRDAHLRSSDFFDVYRYPMLTFESTQMKQVDQNHCILNGDLLLHGVKKTVAFQVAYTGQNRDPLTNTWRIGLSATTIIDRRDFNMQFNQITDGISLVGNETRLEIFTEAIQML
ncbi:YceI family protein [Dictyobacter arantiisoli]|uniref:Polyisoprenoid-binding protein n=1 Tax=Dictyobacter arantiisoli TaxID=2014874 RepID=A0A5A5TDM4_9CHLR|nr:YceI family protein [Dictyobacter arantiisoli]GCF09467.1 polyisoprenoid-binding protein [Dictyobacter arantiisoli]